MTNSVDEPFAFDFIDFTFVDKGEFTQSLELRLLGRITKGRITRELPIVIPTAKGPVIGVIAQFMDTLDDWVGMPFYDWLTPDNMSSQFCLCITGVLASVLPICPGTAHLAPQAEKT